MSLYSCQVALDVRALNALPLNLPPGSEIYTDSAYTDYTAEDDLLETSQIMLKVMRDLEGNTKGAFLQGITNKFSGYELGTVRRDSWFYFTLGKKPSEQTSTVVLSCSPIDAISVAMLEYQVKGIPENRTVYMAVDDTSSLPVERLRNVPHVQVAFTQPTWHGQ